MLDAQAHGLFWVDLMTPSAEEEKATEGHLVDIPTREELAEIEVSARLL